jgi:ABC-type glycerol-3-phosphate transport system substrate-binding protein
MADSRVLHTHKKRGDFVHVLRRKQARSLSVAVLCAALGFGAFATAAAGSSAAAVRHQNSKASSSVTLTFWNSYTGTQVTTIEHTIIPRFEKLNPGIKVVNTSFPYGETLQKYLAAAAAGDPPDVFRTDIAWTAELAGDGVALKVSNLPWYKALVKQALPGPLLTTEYHGSAYSLPLDTNTIALFWNKTDFYAAGIANPPTTVSQLISDAQKLTIPSKDQYGLGVDSTDMWDVSPYIWSMGGSFTNKNYTESGGFMNSGPTITAVKTLVQGYNGGHGYIGPDIISTTGDSGEAEFPSGKYAMYIDGPWAVPTFQALKPVPNFGIVPMPAGVGGSHTPTGGEDVVVSKGGKHLADAELFARFLDSSSSQLTMASIGQMSAFSNDAAAEVKTTPYYKAFAAALKNAYVRPVSKYYGAVDTAFSNAFEEILAGKVSVTQGMDNAANASDAALAGNG